MPTSDFTPPDASDVLPPGADLADGPVPADPAVISTEPEATRRERLAYMALARLITPGHRNALGAESQARRVLDRVLAGDRDPLSRALRTRLAGVDPWERAEADLADAVRVGARIVTPVDAEWPTDAFAALARLAESGATGMAPPLCLWLRGPLSLASTVGRTISIVGARAATAYGKHIASDIAYGLAERTWVVVSGGAFGIDGAAHHAALAAGGATMAVLAGGVDVAHPLAHAGLLDRIAGQGLLVSEVPLGQLPQRHLFLSRNRLVAALGAGAVIVEAGVRSGSIAMADCTHRLGRPLMAVPGPVTSALSVGTHRLIRDRVAILVTSAADVLHDVGHHADESATHPTEEPPTVVVPRDDHFGEDATR